MSTVVEPAPVHAGHHVVQFYEGDADLIARAGAYLADAAHEGAVVIVIATEPHRRLFEAHLAGAGIDVTAARDEGTLVSLDAAATLERFMRDGRVDRHGFLDAVGTVVRTAAATGRPVRAYGEMVSLLWEAGDVVAAIELETLWNDLAADVSFALYCAYRSESVAGHEHALEQVCGLHTAVVPQPPAQASWDFAQDLATTADARRRLGEALGRMGHDGRLLDDARLIVTELAANAVVHARSPYTVSVSGDGASVRIRVRDGSRIMPTVRDESTTLLGGRGLRLVEALAVRWGVDRLPDGKAVWVELAR